MMFWTRSSAFSEREKVATNMKSMAEIPKGLNEQGDVLDLEHD